VNHSGGVDISDLVYLVTFFFQMGEPPPCSEEADLNNSGTIDISDLTYGAEYMFNQGQPPVPCP
jgi:hypothetical protein